MEIPRYIILKDSDNNTIAYMSTKADALKDCFIDTRLNGESRLDFQIPASSEKWQLITSECRIIAGGREFTLLHEDALNTERDENNKLWGKVFALESFETLDLSYIEPSLSNDPSIPSPADLAVIIVGGGSNLSGGAYATGTAAHAMYVVLQGSGWSMGTVDVAGINDLEMEKASRLQLIKEIQNIWGGYLVWDSVNKVVHLRDGGLWQNYTGFQIRYAKNLKHITRTQSNRLVTKMYAFGKDGLDIASINDGYKYLINHSYTPREYVGIYNNPDISDAQELKEKVIAELELACRPRYNYKVKMVDLRTLPEYSHEDFTLGDMADVIDSSVAPDSPRPRIIQHKYNIFKPWDCEIELGDPEERFVEKLKASFDTVGFIDKTFDASGYMSGSKLADLSVTYKQLGVASVTTQAIAPLAVDVSKLAALSVDASKIVNGSITTPKLGDAAVSAQKIADYAITGTKIEAAAIGTAHIQNGAIVNAHIVNGAIGTAKIAEASITSALIKDAAIGSAAIAAGAIGTAHIGTGVIVTAHIGDGQIVSAKIGTAAINSAHIQDLSVTSLKIGDTAITESKLANWSVTNSKIADAAITNAKIADATITTAKIEQLIVGANVVMGPNATISYSQVTNKPYIPALPAYIQSTKITSTTIESPVITGATVNGGNINVDTDLVVGNNIYMGAQYSTDIKKLWFRSGAIIQNAPDSFGGAAAISISGTKLRVDCPEMSSYLNGSDTTKMFGKWDFSNATVTGLNVELRFK